MTVQRTYVHITMTTTTCRYDRRALPGVRGRFGTWAVGKLSTLLTRHAWRGTDTPLTPSQRAKLEALTQVHTHTHMHTHVIQCTSLSAYYRVMISFKN